MLNDMISAELHEQPFPYPAAEHSSPYAPVIDHLYREEVIEARRIYSHDLDPERFREPAANDFYPAKDYHRMYVGEIVRCLAR